MFGVTTANGGHSGVTKRKGQTRAVVPRRIRQEGANQPHQNLLWLMTTKVSWI